MKRVNRKKSIGIFLPIAASSLVIFFLAFPAPATADGNLQIDPMNLDCGVVDEGVPAVMQVRIENVGDSPVLIQNVRTN